MKGLEGLLKCFEHDESFATPTEFNEHKATVPHTYTGTSTCQDCGKKNQPISYTGTLAPGQSPPAICEDCEDKYVDELKARGKIK